MSVRKIKKIKLKTKKAAKKRFRLIAGGTKVKAGFIGKRHCMIKRTKKSNRQKRGSYTIDSTLVSNLLKYSNLHL